MQMGRQLVVRIIRGCKESTLTRSVVPLARPSIHDLRGVKRVPGQPGKGTIMKIIDRVIRKGSILYNVSASVLKRVMVLTAVAASVSQLHASSMAWTAMAPFVDPRTGTGIEGASASLIGGKIYVTHGYRGNDSLLTSIYNIAGNSWTHGGASAPDRLRHTFRNGRRHRLRQTLRHRGKNRTHSSG